MARVTLRRWADAHGYPLATVTRWRHQAEDWPDALDQIGRTYLYDGRALDRWKRAHPELGLGRQSNESTADTALSLDQPA